MELLLAIGDADDNVWTGLSGIVLGIMLFAGLAIWIIKGIKS